MPAAVPEGRILRRPIAHRFASVCLGCVGTLLVAAGAAAAEDADYRLAALGDITALSLEALMDIDVTSVSKHPESISGAAAAVYVLTAEDIGRSGAHSLPEALRLVPGLTVTRITAHSWTVAARGFTATTSDKLEILIDGRSIYTPLFSGVFWDQQDLLMEDIERIEVIRGPGAALWGANAVNGVINVVTKKAADSQGTYVKLAGSGGKGEYHRYGAARYGGRLGENLTYRAYVKSFRSNDQSLDSGGDAQDDADNNQVGFRLDWDTGVRTQATLQGDAYRGSAHTPPSALTGGPSRSQNEFSGGNLLGRLTQNWSAAADTTVQVYFDRTHRQQPGIFEEDRDSWNVDLTHRQQLSASHELVFGGGYHVSRDNIESPNPLLINFTPPRRNLDIYNVFIQDQITLIPERLRLTVGSKFEKNDYTNYEVQPSARLAYTDSEFGTVWAAVSKAVRTPNRVDNDLFSPLLGLSANRDFDAEQATAYELGYRNLLRDNLSLDIAAYYNEYDKLRGVERTSPSTSLIDNSGDGRGYGVETVLIWQAAAGWQVEASHNWQHLNIKRYGDNTDTNIANTNRNDPHNQSMLKSQWTLSGQWQFDAVFRHVSGLEDRNIHGYSELDLRLAWTPIPQLELELVGNNLLARAHPEFTVTNEIERGVVGAITWRFP